MNDAPQLELTDIQGNVLAGFNKDHTSFAFFEIGNADQTSAWFVQHVSEIATTGEVQAFNTAYKVVASRRGSHQSDDVKAVRAMWLNVAFTSSGLTKLARSAGLDLGALPDEFTAGLHSRAADLGHTGDSDPTKWDKAFRSDNPVDGVLIVAADTQRDHDAAVDHYAQDLKANGCNVVDIWHGEARTDEPGHEHFGFKDGLSQPGVEGLDLADPDQPDQVAGKPGTDLIMAGEFVLGYLNQSGSTGLLGVSTAAPSAPSPNPYGGQTPTPPLTLPDCMRNGSFLVLEKLAQDVAGFNAGVVEAASELGLAPELTGSKFVGRHKSGCPMETVASLGGDASITDPSPGTPQLLDDEHINDFGYAADPDGQIVPPAAHIRKTNPRDQTDPGKAEARKHRILRRGIAYGPSLQPAPNPGPYGVNNQDDSKQRGLLFACYQTSIAQQFEFIQRQWVNKPDFPTVSGGTAGVDPILNEANQTSTTVPLASDPTKSISVHNWVTMQGGDYFFSPGIAGLKRLIGVPVDPSAK